MNTGAHDFPHALKKDNIFAQLMTNDDKDYCHNGIDDNSDDE